VEPAPEIAVVIPTHQRRELLKRALGALAVQTIARERYEVVVVCDGCTDGSAEALRAFEGGAADTGPWRLTVLEQENAGAATARNRGARPASAPLLLFLDDDMIAAGDLLGSHLARHAARPGAIVLGAIPVHTDSPRSFLTEGLSRWAERRHAFLSNVPCADGPSGTVPERGAPEVPADEVLTGQLSLARSTFEALGGFDPRFTADGTFGGEDVELGWRAKRLGIPIAYEPRAVSRQVYDKTFRSLCRDIRQSGAADVRMARLHPEIREKLLLGRLSSLSRWERRAARLTLAHPRLAAILAAPVVAFLDLAARLHATGRVFEHLHAICRAHFYALGILDAGV
jgi:GT2 family glycosyltransferase